MAKLLHNDSRRMYSWWWDSHISPKNSKWLQENLTDMDAKVKSMIKLIEEDADSFARRAEMYYKKRPELMKMVEEFYRAYRALAERYDHATGIIRQAHRTMSEACPEQFPMMFGDDSPASTLSGTDLKTPDMSLLNRDFTDDSEPITKRKSSFGSVERVRRGLNFHETEEKEQNVQGNEINVNAKDRNVSESDKESESEEIAKLKEAIAKLEAEKEAGLIQYQQSLDKLSQLEAEISKSREDFKVLNDYAKKAEDEVVVLKDSLSKAEGEKESNLHEYQQCLDKISNLQKCNNERDSEVNSLKSEVDRLSSEKEAALSQYVQSLETISNLENKLRISEEDARCLKERAEKAESEIALLRQTILLLTDEKEASALSYHQCLEKISTLELKLACAEEEARRLNEEIDNGTSKLKGVEEHCLMLERSNQSLHIELESLALKMGTQTEELTEKQKELGRLWTCVQEERLRFVEAETAFQTLQRLHAQTQDELRATASELQSRVQLLKAVEAQNQSLEEEVLKVKEQNKNLDELNASSALSIKDMQNEISSLVESKGKLEQEVELRVDQRNALQQEIYCLREELNDVRTKHHSILDQVHEVGLNPDSFGSSVKELKEENSNLRETGEREALEKAALLEKLVILDKLLEKNSLLETSLSDLNAELESVRVKMESLERSCETLLQEKSTLLEEKAAVTAQFEEANKNLEKLSETNTVLVSSLTDVQHQLEALKARSKILEDLCQLLVNEKAGLVSANDGLTNQLKATQTSLEELDKLHRELEGRCVDLENEKESTLRKVEELQMNLEMERQEHASYVAMSEARLGGVEAEMHLLQEECLFKSKELDQMLVSAMDNEIELSVLRLTSQEMKNYNCSLLKKNQTLLEESVLSEKKISMLEKNSSEQKDEIRSLSVQVDRLRAGNGKLLEVLDIVEDPTCKDRAEQDRVHANFLVSKLQEMKEALVKVEEENLLKTVDSSVLVTWIKQLKLDLQNIEMEKNKFECDVKEKTDHVSELQKEVHTLLVMNEELKSKLKEGASQKDALMNQIDDLNMKLLDVQETCKILEKENLDASHENRSLEEKNMSLSYEIDDLSGKVFDLVNFSSIFRSCADEKFMVLKQLGNNVEKLHDVNAALLGKLSFTEEKLQESKTENINLKEILQTSENQLNAVSTVKDRMEQKLKEAEDKLSLEGDEKVHLKKNLEDLITELSEVKLVRDQHEGRIDKLSADNEQIDSQLKMKINELDELETEAASIFCQLQYLLVSHLLYEQKFHALRDQCLDYADQNEALKTQLAAYGPEIASLKECIMSLENHTDIHIKFQNPQSEDEQGKEAAADPHEGVSKEDNKASILSSFTELHDLRVRLEAIVKSAVEIKEQILRENANLQSKLDASTRQLELLHSEGHLRPASEITDETDNATLLTKDIVLDQVSDGSSYGFSKRDHHLDSDDQIIELWDSRDLDRKSKKAVSPRNSRSTEFRRAKSLKKPKSSNSNSDLAAIEKDLSIDKLEISKRSTDPLQETTNKRKVLERLDSDVQKLANLQITVRDLKRILEVTEKGKRGKSVIECEAIKGQLEEADVAVMKLFDLNARLMKNVENDRDDHNASLRDSTKSSFDSDRDGNSKMRKVLEQARRTSEKIGRLQMEIQKLQFILLKMDDENKGRHKLSESKRRVLLRDYLYGVGRTGERGKKTRFCACVQPSTVED